MAAKLPSARDSVLVFADADGIEHVLSIGSPEWYTWLADEEHRSFIFVCQCVYAQENDNAGVLSNPCTGPPRPVLVGVVR